MNVARLMKLAPTLILVGFAGYSLFAIESGIPGAAETIRLRSLGASRTAA